VDQTIWGRAEINRPESRRTSAHLHSVLNDRQVTNRPSEDPIVDQVADGAGDHRAQVISDLLKPLRVASEAWLISRSLRREQAVPTDRLQRPTHE
jgi:hypothetical protein